MRGSASLRGVSTDRPSSSADTRAGSYPRLPSQSILHGEDISDPPLNVRALLVCGLVGWALFGFLAVGIYDLISFIFAR